MENCPKCKSTNRVKNGVINKLDVTFPTACKLTKFLKFDIVQVQLDIAFDQLVQLAKRLPARHWTKLKQEVESQTPTNKEREDFKKLLLNAPTFSKKQLDAVAETRKAINQWRTK